MLEKKGTDAHYYKSVVSVIFFFNTSSRFRLYERAHARTHSHCLSFVFCSGRFMWAVSITRVCVTCERTI